MGISFTGRFKTLNYVKTGIAITGWDITSTLMANATVFTLCIGVKEK